MRTRRRLAPAALVLALACPAAAHAGAPGSWTPVGTTDQLNISDLAGLARTTDGALHVAWHRRVAATSTYDLLTTPVASNGTVGAAVPIVTGWSSIEGPTVLPRGAGLAAFWSGTRTLTTGDPQEGVDMATSADGGRSWAVSPTAIAQGDFAAARDVAVAAVGSTYVQSWYAGRETVVHVGLDRSTPNQRGFGDGANQNIVSLGGPPIVAWCTGVQGANGVFVQGVDLASGGPTGAPVLMPGSTVVRSGVPETFCPASARVALVGRAGGGGFYVLATDADRRAVRLWRVGSPASATLARGDASKQQLALAADPNGRLWAGWMEDGKLMLRRSNKTATVFGAPVEANGPPPDGTAYQLDLSGQADRVDAVARTNGTGAGVALYHTQSYPGLSLRARGGRRASFRVTDAGDPVAGVRIRVAGRTLTTGGDGRTSAALPAGRFTATASKRRYVGATTAVRVARRRR